MRLHPSVRTTLLAAVVTAALTCPLAVSAQGLTYTLVPSARWIEWDEDLGFERSRMLGGALGIGFGRYVGLVAFHHQEDGVDLFGDPDAGRVDLAQSGAQVTLAFGTGTLVPIVTGGGSVMHFQPGDDEPSTSRLSYDVGAGLRAVFGETIHGELLVESSHFRLGAEAADPFATGGDDRRNLSLRAGIGIQLGRRTLDQASELDQAFAERYRSPFSGLALAVTPLVGRLDFDESTGLGRQDMYGVRAGLDFGSFFGLRGLYWWGSDEPFGSRDGFEAWGGEAQFNLGAGAGLNPHLIGGVSRLTWDPEAMEDVEPPPDQTALVLGGGVDLNLGSRIRATFAARDFILAGSEVEGDLGDASNPDDLVHNWHLSGGLKFLIGGGGGIRSDRPEVGDGRVRTEEDPVARAVERAAGDSVVMAVTPEGDTIQVRLVEGQGRVMVIPVLEQGEITIRFGPPAPDAGALAAAGVDETTLRRLIREELAAMGLDPARTGMTDAEIRALEERLARRVGAAPPPEADATPRRDAEPSTPDGASVSRGIRELRPLTGFGQGQVLLGLAADIGPLSPGSSIRVVPQVTFGFGDGRTSYLAHLGLEYRFGELRLGSDLALAPMLGLGPSVFGRGNTDVRLTSWLGSAVRLFDDGGEPRANLVVGLQNIDLVRDTRLLVGLRLIR